MARVFHTISSTYRWDDDEILDKTLRRIRQILAVILEDKYNQRREQRLIISWQTRSIAMVAAAAGANANEDLMTYASNLTIDYEEYQEFGKVESKSVSSNLPVHGSTQDVATQENFEKSADKNSFEMLEMLAFGMDNPPPG